MITGEAGKPWLVQHGHDEAGEMRKSQLELLHLNLINSSCDDGERLLHASTYNQIILYMVTMATRDSKIENNAIHHCLLTSTQGVKTKVVTANLGG